METAPLNPHLLPHTRVHKLNRNFGPDCSVFVKREDETGYSISGNKRRKYASLLPWLHKNQYESVAVIGGARSNNVVGICQLLIEQGIVPIPFLREAHGPPDPGNPLLLRLLVPEEQIQWVSGQDWPRVESIARAFADQAKPRTYVLPEGANCPPALPGALTLLADIQQNESEHGIHFDHILIDAGTGLTAAALALANAALPQPKGIHILLLAGDETSFAAHMEQVATWFQPPFPLPSYRIHIPKSAKSFGAVNRTTLDGLVKIAREEGILTDPVYSAKLFNEAAGIIERETLTGNVLLIHSGGGQALPSFAQKLFPLV